MIEDQKLSLKVIGVWALSILLLGILFSQFLMDFDQNRRLKKLEAPKIVIGRYKQFNVNQRGNYPRPADIERPVP